MRLPSEAVITISGTDLTFGQSMTVRVAIENFAMSLVEENALGDDDLGRSIAEGYKARISEIRALIAETAN